MQRTVQNVNDAAAARILFQIVTLCSGIVPVTSHLGLEVVRRHLGRYHQPRRLSCAILSQSFLANLSRAGQSFTNCWNNAYSLLDRTGSSFLLTQTIHSTFIAWSRPVALQSAADSQHSSIQHVNIIPNSGLWKVHHFRAVEQSAR